MSKSILVLNAGSSSIKFAVYRAAGMPQRGDLICEGEIENIARCPHFFAKSSGGETLLDKNLDRSGTHEAVLAVLLDWLGGFLDGKDLIAAGHRVVHGGSRFIAPVRIDDAVLAGIRSLIPLAPLHQPHHVAAIEALFKLHPKLAQVACFDTAFQHGRPAVASMYALPRRLTGEGVRPYGFHGLSYEYIASVLPDYMGAGADGRIVVAHLGAGASMCALHRRKSVATTMGFTALDGLPMGTRSGALDPGVLLYLMQEKGMSAAAISQMLYRESGMLGVSAISDDMRTLLASGDPRAKEAVDFFVYRIGRELGSLAAALGGLDALVFTAGIGEHSPEIRLRVLKDASWLGFVPDENGNASGEPCVTAPSSRVSAWVIPTDEDLIIARQSWDAVRKQAS